MSAASSLYKRTMEETAIGSADTRAPALVVVRVLTATSRPATEMQAATSRPLKVLLRKRH